MGCEVVKRPLKYFQAFLLEEKNSLSVEFWNPVFEVAGKNLWGAEDRFFDEATIDICLFKWFKQSIFDLLRVHL